MKENNPIKKKNIFSKKSLLPFTRKKKRKVRSKKHLLINSSYGSYYDLFTKEWEWEQLSNHNIE